LKSIDEFIVPWVRQSEPYSARHMDFASENPHLIRMMSNENLLPPSPEVLDAVLQAARSANLYPDSGPRLRQRIAEGAGLSPDQVVLGNGSTDIINIVVHTFVAPGEDAVISVPTFPMYEARVRIAGGETTLVPMTKDFYWDVDAILAAVTPRTKLIFICSPNNPTGNQIDESDLRRILALGVPLFFDEAYYELEDAVASRASWIKDDPHMMVNRTFSKAFGLAGFRIGYLLCEAGLANYFNRVKIPWNVSLIALAAALAGLEDEQDQEFKRHNTLAGRQYIYDAINSMPGFKAFPSEGNFVLIDASPLGKPSAEIMQAMIERGIFIRPMSGHNMPHGFIRITVGTPEQNQQFIETFRMYVAEVLDAPA
jgi:histidinol-phosphate aminotransferase